MDPRDLDGNIFLFTHKEPLDLAVLHHRVASDDLEEFLEYMRANLLGRVFYMEGDGTYVTCFAGRRQRIDDAVYDQLKPADLAKEVKANPRNVPNWEGDQSTLHWIQFVCNTRDYHQYLARRMNGAKRKLMSVTLSPQSSPPHDVCYLVAAAPPLYAPLYTAITNEHEFENYVNSALSVKLPGTTVSAVRWFLSFMYWVRFDGDIPSFLTSIVMYAFAIHPQCWSPGKLFIITGEQGTGKSEMLNLLTRFMNTINYTDPSIGMMTANKFNSSLIKPRWVCQEAGSGWYKKLNSDFLRSMITDQGCHEFEAKFGKQFRVMGSIMAIVIADRSGGPATVAEKQERRHLFLKVAKEPKNSADYKNFHRSFKLFSSLFSHSNENLVEFREQFRQAFVNYLGPIFGYVSPSGLQVPRVLQGRDGFDEALDENETASVKRSSAPAAKRAKTAVSASAATAANECARHLAMNGSIFPLIDPDVFYYLFHNLTIFNEPDGIDKKHSFQRRLWHLTWTHDNSSFEYNRKVYTDTLYTIYQQWKAGDTESQQVMTVDDKALQKTDIYYKMLAKFKCTMMARHMFAFGNEPLMAWPKLLSKECALWILGLWMNFLGNSGKIKVEQAMWGDSCSMQEYLLPSARMLLNRISGRDNFSSGKHVVITNIKETLRVDPSPYLGIGVNELSVRPVQLYWGPFSILRNLVVHEGQTFRPTEEEVQSILSMIGGEAFLVDKNRADYDWLISSTHSHLLKQMCKIIEEQGIDAQEDDSRIYYALFADQFSDGPFGLMKKDEFYQTLDSIEINVPKPRKLSIYRPSVVLRSSPAALGDTNSTETVTISPPPTTGLSTADQRIKEREKTIRKEIRSPSLSPTIVVSADDFEYPSEQTQEWTGSPPLALVAESALSSLSPQ